MKDKYTIIAGIIFVAIIALAIFFAFDKKETNTKAENTKIEIQANDAVKGNRNSEVVLVEYSDFQCPACAYYYPMVKEVIAEFGNQIAVVYKHFPLRQIHDKAQLGGEVAEAAGKQGKFWEMHDKIFENQKSWSELSVTEAEKIFTTYAQELGLNLEQFKNDLKSTEVKEKVNADFESGVAMGVRGTPTFFLNGKKLEVRSYADFKKAILAELQK